MKIKFFELAKKMSFKSNHRQHKIGGVLVKKNRVISIGFNKLKTHTKSNTEYRSTHCELDVILGCTREELSGATLYLYRGYKDGSCALSKPCEACTQLIIEADIKKVIYSIDGGFKEELVSNWK